MANLHRRRTILILLAGSALVVVFGFWWAWPRPPIVETVAVERGMVRATVLDLGRTEVREPYAIAAPVAGRLRRIAVEPGDVVAAGAVVAWIDPAQSTPLDSRSRTALQASLREAEAKADAAQSVWDNANREAERLRQLAEKQLVADQEASEARARVRTARADFAGAQASVARIQAELADTNGEGPPIAVLSPVDGTVLERFARSARPVAAGEALMEIGDPTDLHIVAPFLSQDAARIPVGARAWIEAWGGPAIPARVRRVSPTGHQTISALGVEEQRVEVWIDPEAPLPGLGHGFQVEARIEISQQPDALRVPVESLVLDDAGWRIWRIRGGRLEVIPVRPGATEGKWRAVEGVAVGDRVVRVPTPEMRPGQRVVDAALIEADPPR